MVKVNCSINSCIILRVTTGSSYTSPYRSYANLIDESEGSSSDPTENTHSGGRSTFRPFVDSSLDWSGIDWIKSVTKMPVILKGILTAEDAILACDHGIQAIYVSNHGGRQLDSAPATIEVLPEIVRAVNDRQCEIYVDGGVRTGNSVFKALALGARAVFVGRPILYGLAVSGRSGVSKILDILNHELRTTMALAGCVDLEALLDSRFGIYQTRDRSNFAEIIVVAN
uniref:FMN hydroxy acid dehydrogenase domain-containing protein n=1 Tax=Romanomermis culicivorax TaxID=13658 RepID=A0A915IT50_ROMCU